MISKREKRLESLKETDYYKMTKKMYPDLPILSNEEYKELKIGYFNDDVKSAETLKLAMLHYVSESLIYLYIDNNDISYRFEEALQDTYLEVAPFLENALLQSPSISLFRSYIFKSTFHRFANLNYCRELTNLDVYCQNQNLKKVNPDIISEYETGLLEQEREALIAERKEKLLKVLKKALLPREARLIKDNFGIDGKQPMPCLKLAGVLGISLGRVGQIRLNAIKKLQHPMYSHKIERLIEIEME